MIYLKYILLLKTGKEIPMWLISKSEKRVKTIHQCLLYRSKRSFYFKWTVALLLRSDTALIPILTLSNTKAHQYHTHLLLTSIEHTLSNPFSYLWFFLCILNNTHSPESSFAYFSKNCLFTMNFFQKIEFLQWEITFTRKFPI